MADYPENFPQPQPSEMPMYDQTLAKMNEAAQKIGRAHV